MNLQVLAPTTANVNITVSIRPAVGFTFAQAKEDAEAALRAAFTGALLGKGVTLAFLGNLLYDLESVSNYRFALPASDLAARSTVLPKLGNITIRERGGRYGGEI